MLEQLATSPTFLLTLAGLLGLIIGSFLNVVAYRLPIMLETRWKEECAALHNHAVPGPRSRFNLLVPRSTCPSCGHMITALENIPVLSYLFLRGRCSACKAPISIQYPVVELVTGLLSLYAAWHFGVSLELYAALVLTWILVALTVIDLNRHLLPDALTQPLLWIGLLVNLGGVFTDYTSSLLGAVFGYLALWTVFHLFKLVTGKEGMGYGDFKLLAALGAWLGWQVLPLIIILSSLIGAVVGGALMFANRHQRGNPLPFGPFLAGAGLVALYWGDSLIEGYLRFSGLGG